MNKVHVTTIVNGDETEFLCEPHDTLLDVLLQTLIQTGQFKRAMLDVNRQQVAAVRLYERCGFESVRNQPVQMGDGQTYTGIVMERPLD